MNRAPFGEPDSFCALAFRHGHVDFVRSSGLGLRDTQWGRPCAALPVRVDPSAVENIFRLRELLDQFRPTAQCHPHRQNVANR